MRGQQAKQSLLPFSSLSLGIFVAGYITARWDLVTRLYELAIFAAEYGVVVCSPLDATSLAIATLNNIACTTDSRCQGRRRLDCSVPHHFPPRRIPREEGDASGEQDRKSTRLNSSH